MAKKSTDAVSLKLRFYKLLHSKIARAAERNKRSMNREIVSRLETSFGKDTIENIEMKDLIELWAELQHLRAIQSINEERIARR